MKICYLNVIYPDGSTGRIVDELIAYLRSKNDDFLVVHGRGKKIHGDKDVLFPHINTYLHCLRTRILGYSWKGGSLIATKRLFRLLKREKPDIVHIHELHGYYLNCESVVNYCVSEGIPVVYTLHDEFLYTGKCGSTLGCPQFKTQCEKCPQLKKYPKSLFFDRSNEEFLSKKKALANAQNFFFTSVSRWVAENARSSNILRGRKVNVIGNGIDTQVFKPTYGGEKKGLLVVSSDFSNPVKGSDFLNTLIDWAGHSVFSDCRFVLVGPHGESFKNKDNVDYVGYVKNPKELADLYNKCSGTIVASYSETFSIPAVESLCCGTPVFAFSGSGGPEEIINPQRGIIFPTRDPERVLTGISSFLASPPLNRQELAEEARADFSIESMCKKYYKLYQQVLKRK